MKSIMLRWSPRSHSNGSVVPVYLAENSREVNMGMSTFGDRYPDRGMLFPLRGNYSTFTMDGVKFPLEVYMMDVSGNILDHFIVHPGTKDRQITANTYWMLEFPLHA